VDPSVVFLGWRQRSAHTPLSIEPSYLIQGAYLRSSLGKVLVVDSLKFGV
jgi:hypothetical protein